MKTLTSQQVKRLEQQSSSFGKAYFQYFQLYNLTVLPHLISTDPGHLDLDIQKINKDQEWAPVIASLKKNRDLERLEIYSDSKINNTESTRFVRIIPDILNGVKDGLMLNPHLHTLEITNIVLKDTHLQILAKGLLNNASLNHFSLSRSKIGDSGLFVLAPALRTLKNLRVLNLSACNLSEKGAYIISMFLKSLAVCRQADVWKHSLRLSPLDADPKFTQSPVREAPKSLKRLLLCHNSLKNAGASILFDLLMEEVGLIALDLQFNQITEECGKKSITLLKINRDLCILDLRNNDVEKQTLNKLNQYLVVNEKLRAVAHPLTDPDLEWLDAKDPLKIDKVERSRLLQQTKSSAGKLNASSNPNLSNSMSKIDSGLKALKEKSKISAPRKSLSSGTKKLAIKNSAIPPNARGNAIANNVSNLASNRKPNTGKPQPLKHKKPTRSGTTKHRHDPREVEMVLRALDNYYNRTGESGIKKLSEGGQRSAHTEEKPLENTTTQLSTTVDHVNEKENEQLKKRVDDLEKLVKSLLASISANGDKTTAGIVHENNHLGLSVESYTTPQPRSVHFDKDDKWMSNFDNDKLPDQSLPSNSNYTSEISIQRHPYSTDIGTIIPQMRENDLKYLKEMELPPLPGYSDKLHYDYSKVVKSSPDRNESIELKGTLQQPKSSLEEMIEVLESSLNGFHKVLDKLEAGIAQT